MSVIINLRIWILFLKKLFISYKIIGQILCVSKNDFIWLIIYKDILDFLFKKNKITISELKKRCHKDVKELLIHHENNFFQKIEYKVFYDFASINCIEDLMLNIINFL